MDVVVKSRHCSVPDQFRAYVDDRITRLEKLDDRVIRVEVEVSAERNPRQHDQACRVEITLRTKGPVVRAEAVPMTLDQALMAMELVGHDFYLFIDSETLSPSVVYRRRAYDYGVIRLTAESELAAVSAASRPNPDWARIWVP